MNRLRHHHHHLALAATLACMLGLAVFFSGHGITRAASSFSLSLTTPSKTVVGGSSITLTYSASGVDLLSCSIHWPYADITKGDQVKLNEPHAFSKDLPDNHPWMADVAFSADGTVAATGQYGGPIYIAKLTANNWPFRDSGSPNRLWTGVALSGDGKKIVAASTRKVVNGAIQQTGAVYLSTNGGNTWSSIDELGDKWWTDVAMSADGMKIIAAAGISGDYLHISTDGGTTWKNLTSAGARNWRAVSMTPDGNTIAATTYSSGQLLISNDGGSTWNARLGSGWWWDVAMTPDGKDLVTADSQNGFIYTSTDGGVTWMQRYNNAYWAGVAISDDGQTIVASPSAYGPRNSDTDYKRYSKDGGVHWTRQPTYDGAVRSWMGAGVSPDGKWIFAGTQTDADYPNSSPFYSGAPPFDTAGGRTVLYLTAPPRTWTISLVCQVNGANQVASVVVKVAANNCLDAERAPGTPTENESYQAQGYILQPYDDVLDTESIYRDIDDVGYKTEYVCLRNNGPDPIFVPTKTIDEWKTFVNALPDMDVDIMSHSICNQQGSCNYLQ